MMRSRANGAKRQRLRRKLIVNSTFDWPAKPRGLWALVAAVIVLAAAGEASSAMQGDSERSLDAGGAEVSQRDVANAESSAGQNPAASSPVAGVVAASTKILRHAERLMARYDGDGSGRLEKGEWTSLPSDPSAADSDGDGRLTVEEIAQRIARYAASGPRLGRRSSSSDSPPTRTNALNESAATGDGTEMDATRSGERSSRPFFVPAERLPQGLPPWFLAADANGDAQLDLAEFLTAGQAGAATFEKLDVNRDGLLTAREWVASRKNEKASPDSQPNDGQASDGPSNDGA